ncbi:MAG TPA: trigger factor [Lachnospiraceae bacterium]|jgi:trigger factor|nr:trigger factor [Lachnospiraceae bacterium]
MKKVLFAGMLAGVAILAAGCSTKVDPDKYVTLGQYKGLEAAKTIAEVTDEEVEAQIETILQGNATTEEVKDRKEVKDGDILNIDYEGKLDGVAFENGTATGATLTIGSGQFIPGFEDALIGKKVGETTDIDVTFPDPYPNDPEMAGKPVVFTVTINSISKQVIPELTDELVSTFSAEASTVAEYKEKLKEQMLESKKSSAENELMTSLWSQAYANATVVDEIPEELIAQKTDTMYKNVQMYAEAYGITFAEFLTNYMMLTEEQFADEAKGYALEAAKESLVLAAIAKAEGLEITKEELAEKITEYTALYQYASEDEFKEGNDMVAFEESLLKEKVQNFIQENAVIKEAAEAEAAEPEEEATETEAE